MKFPILNHKALDKEHREILLYLVQIKNNRENNTYKSLEVFKQYLLQHAHNEEQLMRELDYSGLDGHLKAHAKLTERVGALTAGMLGVDLLGQLLLHHIHTEDRKFAEWKKLLQDPDAYTYSE
jgi:hemerythrin-like metal-binding protein